MQINPSEVTKILKEQIQKNLEKKPRSQRVGQVLISGWMVLPEFMVWTMFRPEKWLNFLPDL